MNRYPENTNAILLTNVNGSGDDVMAFTSLDVDTLAKAYRRAGGVAWDEMYLVPDSDVGYCLYEPAFLTLAEELRARELAAEFDAASKELATASE